MSSPAVERIRAALETAGVELECHTDGSWRGRCPLHSGITKTSLSFRHHTPKGSGSGRVQLRCWAGCDERDILAHIGLRLADLYDQPPPKTSGTVTREHVYLSPGGQHLVGVVRRVEPKSFRPAIPTAGGWVAKASPELKNALYRHPAVTVAVENDQPVWVTEGERDADRLAREGITATCNTGGAGKWTAEHARWLQGADVVVCRDRDDAGRRHAEQVVASLAGVARSVRLVEPAEGKDITDHLDAGRTLDEVVELDLPKPAAEPQAAGAVVVPLSTVQPERLSWLWLGRIPAGKLATLDGDPSVGKSTLAVELAAHVSTGTPWPDGAPCPLGDVLILSAEDGLADTIRPRLDAAGGDPARVHALTAVMVPDENGERVERPPTLADIGPITTAIRETGARLVIVDVLMAYLPGRVDSHKDQDIRAVLSRLAAMCEDTGAALLLLRHLNKAGSGSPMYRGGGSIGIVGAARVGYLVARDPDDPETRVLACVKSNLAREPESLTYRLESAPDTDVARVKWIGTSAHDAAGLLRHDGEDVDERRAIDEFLRELMQDNENRLDARKVQTAVRHAGFSWDQAKRAKKRLGITSEKGGMEGGWDWVLLPAEGSTKGAKSADTVSPLPSHSSPLPSAREDEPAETPPAPLWPRCACGNEIYDGNRSVCGRCLTEENK